MRTSGSRRSRLLALPTAALLVLAACGGGDNDESADESGETAAGQGEAVDAAENDVEGGNDAGEGGDTLTTGGVDLGGPEIDPASEIESNLLPDLVVDDVGRGKKVNIRNVVPSDKPVLLWMWAPH